MVTEISKPHNGITCDVCKYDNIKGTRFACLVCTNYDLCETCQAGKQYSGHHRPNHPVQPCVIPSDQLTIGAKIVTELRHFRCPLCTCKDFSMSGLLQHCELYHAENDDSVRCPICVMHGVDDFSTAPLEVSLLEHLKNHSYYCNVFSRDIGGNRYVCLICENYDLCQRCHEAKRYNDEHTCYHPTQLVSQEEPRSEQLQANGRDVSVPQIYRCPCCDAKDFIIQDLTSHCQRYHPVQKQVRCPICAVLRIPNQNFPLNDGFLKHLKEYHYAVDNATEESRECAICFENITTNERFIRCGHSFHTSCIATWLENNTTCPICRIDQRE